MMFWGHTSIFFLYIAVALCQKHENFDTRYRYHETNTSTNNDYQHRRGNQIGSMSMDDIPEMVDHVQENNTDVTTTTTTTRTTTTTNFFQDPHCPYNLLSWECTEGEGPTLVNR